MELDFSILTDDQLVTLIRSALQEAVRRSPATAAAAQAATLDEAEKARIARVAAERAAAEVREAEERRLAAAAAAQARRDAEAAATAAEWAAKEAIGARVREILGTEVLEPIDYSRQQVRLAYLRKVLGEARAEDGKWAVGSYTPRWGTRAEAEAWKAGLPIPTDEAVRRVDNAARIAEMEAEAATLEAEMAGPTHRRRAQRYRLEVWSRGGDVRVYIARTGAKFGESLYDYFHTGNRTQKPGSAKCIYREVDEAAAARGVTRGAIFGGLKALCADLCTKYTALKIEEC
jgi:hypothetical protein